MKIILGDNKSSTFKFEMAIGIEIGLGLEVAFGWTGMITSSATAEIDDGPHGASTLS